MNPMRRFRAIAMLALVAIFATGCDGSPTPTIAPTRTPQTPATATPVVTAPPPTATPTPQPALTSLDLGVPAGDTYNVAGGVLDAERGLLYAIATDGDF